MNVHDRDTPDRRMQCRLRPALDEARHGLAAFAGQQGRTIGIGLFEIESDIEAVADELLSVAQQRNDLGRPCSSLGISVKPTGAMSKVRPLWASDSFVFHTCGEKGRLVSVPESA